MGQGLAPAMQDRNHAGLGPRCFGSAPMVRTVSAAALNSVDDRLVLQGDGGERGRHGEDEVKILDWQEFGAAVGQPLGADQALALGAVSIAAGIVGDAEYLNKRADKAEGSDAAWITGRSGTDLLSVRDGCGVSS